MTPLTSLATAEVAVTKEPGLRVVHYQKMSPAEIRAELVRRGIKLVDIAGECGVTPQAIHQAINQGPRYKGQRIRPVIANAIGKQVQEIWPDHDSISKSSPNRRRRNTKKTRI